MRTKAMLMCAAALATVQLSGSALQAQGPKFRETVSVKANAITGIGDYALTFSAPVALPGVSLGAGTYIFRRPAGNVLQVMNTAGKPYALLLTIPASRMTADDEYSVVFGPGAAPGSPKRIVALFEPGEMTGHEFVYATR